MKGLSVLLTGLVALVGAVYGQRDTSKFVDGAAVRTGALEAERNLDWQAAFDDWESILDRSQSSDALRFEAIAHVHDLRSKIPAADVKARSWPTLVVIFRHMDVTWKDKGGRTRRFRSAMTAAEIERIHKAVDTYRGYVSRYTDGILRVDPTYSVVDEPIMSVQGGSGFWVGPDNERPTLLRLMGSKKYQSVFVYEKFREGDDALPQAFAGGTYGADQGLNGAAFSEILWNPMRATDGEVELHEWLHQIDWMFTNVLGYPQAASVNPDMGRRVGEEGGDLDYRRPVSSLSWMDFYIHIMQDHVTREMWREATMHDPAPNAWLLRRSQGSLHSS